LIVIGARDQFMALPYALRAGAGVHPDDSATKASGASTGGAFTLIESVTDGGAPRHVHTREDEYMYVVEGNIWVQVGDERYELGPRGFVFMPRNIPHGWDVIGDKATVLMMTVPAGLDAFLERFHVAANWDERNAIAAEFGITFLP
jgi:mannose-6-phosphate isomerase-like protein (cupin superfamily)